MRTNTSEVENTVKNKKKGTLRGHLAQVSPDVIPFHPPSDGKRKPDTTDKTTRAAKSSVDYWKDRVRPRTLKNGTQTPELYLRLKEGGRDAWFCLNTANRATAAGKARDLWQKVKVQGLVAVLAELSPDARPARSASIGELLTAAKAIATCRASSFHQYEVSIRRLVAGVLGMEATASVFYHKSAEAKAWRAKIESASLDVLTDERVERWRKAYVDAADDEVARISRKNTAAATIRNARALLAPDMIKAMGDKLRIPSPAPLSGLAIGGATRRFKTTVDPRQLYSAAAEELSGDVLTAFTLCLVAGLRKGEADMLPWENIDLDAALVHVRPTKFFLPKTEESQRTTPIPADVVAYLRKKRAETPDAAFVLAGINPTDLDPAKGYRCPCWRPLIAWLRAKAFVSPNPVHELRKLSGSLVNSVAGLEAARRHLGHRNISTTAASYVTGSAAMINLTAKPETLALRIENAPAKRISQ